MNQDVLESGKFLPLDLDSWTLESGFQLKESGIQVPLTGNPESST